MIDASRQKIEEVLDRGVQNIYPNKKDLASVLTSGKKLKIYHGIDPTGKLHIGHIVPLKKLRQLQDLGHEIIVLFGDFTAMIGDPTDKNATRKPLTRKQVLENTKNYKQQIGKILDLTKANIKFLHNEEWSNKLKPTDMLELASHFTVARLLERDMFQERIKAGREIHVHEFLYPIFQAYDSVTMDVDMEVGGNDQTFNMLAGRDLMQKLKNKEKFVLSLKLLTDSSGKKMGKTEGNMVNLDEDPLQVFGKIMSWPDGLIIPGLELLTDMSMREIETKSKKMREGIFNPRDLKIQLATEVVSVCYNTKIAKIAEAEFEKIFKKKEVPSEMEEIKLPEKEMKITDIAVQLGLAESQSQAKRLMLQGGYKIDGKVEKDWKKMIKIRKGQVFQAGKRKFKKII